MPSHLQWWMPYGKNPFFTGHSALLATLHECIKQSPIILGGIGGIGKSTLAVEYAHSYKDSYSAIIWLEASSSIHLNAQLMEISSDRPALFNNIWADAKATLLILDNIENVSIVQHLLPQQWKGDLLLTSRFQLTVFPILPIPPLSQDESTVLLLRRGKRISKQGNLQEASDTDRKAAAEIAQEMDGFPLALDQAGAYLEEGGFTPTHYLSLYREQSARLLGKRGRITDPIHPDSVAVTVANTVHCLTLASQELLRLLAFLPPDAIPFYPTFGRKEFDDLLHCFLIQPRGHSTTLFCMHRIIQTVIIELLTKEQRQFYANLVDILRK